MKRCLYAGSFSPLTNGHSWMIQEASRLFDEVLVGVAQNTEKNSTFTLEERVKMVESLKIPGVTVKPLPQEYTVNFADQNDIEYLVRGVRNATDFEYERTIELLNTNINPTVRTVYLAPPSELIQVSSSVVRGLIGFRGWRRQTEKYVPQYVQDLLLEKYAFKQWSELGLRMREFHKKDTWDKYFSVIRCAYQAAPRSYHTLDHILMGLEEIDAFPFGSWKDGIKLAWWFHGIIQDNQGACEARSAEKYLEFCKDVGMAHVMEYGVPDYIRSTAHMEATPTEKTAFWDKADDAAVDLMHDVDLAILGQPLPEYTRYANNVSKEYPGIPVESYAAARKALFLDVFSAKDRIFSTDHYQKCYEEQARKNLKAERQYIESILTIGFNGTPYDFNYGDTE